MTYILEADAFALGNCLCPDRGLVIVVPTLILGLHVNFVYIHGFRGVFSFLRAVKPASGRTLYSPIRWGKTNIKFI